jgi:3-oxoacyl-[acyl-carrier protein] reductase
VETGLAGQGVVVTGASGGIGAACARAFADEGARVLVHYHRGEERARALAGGARRGAGRTGPT